MADIRLHPQHGVNPTIPQCFWCGEDKNEVVLLGAAYKGEAPRHMLIDYNPCEKCAAHMSQGVHLIEIEPQHDRPPLAREGALSRYQPTGRYLIVQDTVIEQIINGPQVVKDILLARKAIVDQESFTQILSRVAP